MQKRTFSNQESLPKLPVPDLDHTFSLYRETIEPLLTPSEFSTVQKNIQEFLSSKTSSELQHLLLEKKKKCDSEGKGHWLTDWWDRSYFGDRGSIVGWVNYSFFLDYYKPLVHFDQVLLRAGRVITGALAFKHLIDTETLPPEYIGTTPLDMTAFKFMFSVCRIPADPEDFLRISTESRHIIVTRKGHWYRLNVLDSNFRSFSSNQIANELLKIVQHADSMKQSLNGGCLTADTRSNWTLIRPRLLEQNKETMDCIENSIFLLCLDDSQPQSFDQVHMNVLLGKAENRWFDKSLQFIVFENGIVGFNGEHSKLDGMPAATLTEFIISYKEIPSGAVDSPKFTPLIWKADGPLKESILESTISYLKHASHFELRVLRWQSYGSRFIKQVAKVSPDAFMQMAFQWTYFKMFRTFVATYESAQTKKYFCGRTETGRVLSKASKAWVLSMDDEKSSVEDRRKLLIKACESHVKYMRVACEANGCDRHLLGLKMMAQESKIPLPAVFTDVGFQKSFHHNISTSQLSSDHFFVSFGPVVEDGFGICYCIRNDELLASISARSTFLFTDVHKFWFLLNQTLFEMRALFESTSFSISYSSFSKL